jgi:hypothetical protein
LVQLCRVQKWIEVVHRCHYYPEEACLVPITVDVQRNDNVFRRHSITRSSIKSIHGEDDEQTPLFRQTALGIVCDSKDIGTEEAKMAIMALVQANPSQLCASQNIPGHTPLRDALLNERCTFEIFRFLAGAAAASRGGDLVLGQKDRNGLSPLDHLVTSVQLGSSSDSVAMLKDFLRVKQSACTTPSFDDRTSPLIRLLTMGNAFHSSASPMKSAHFPWEHRPKDSKNDAARLQRVLRATRLLLDDDPHLLGRCSKLTRCTPLHIALRNYGNFPPLVQELLKRDPANKMVQVRNSYGDLPIHVACSVGVPFEVLSLVVECTVRVTIDANTNIAIMEQDVTPSSRYSLIWSSNKSGYTPVDLEWISHIEGTNGLYTARPFSPSDANGVRQHCFKQDAYYRDLLKESVDQVMERHNSVCNGEKAENEVESRKTEAKIVFGDFLDRISLLIRAASATNESNFCVNTKSSTKLVESCKLGTLYSPSLPLPVLELFLWLHPEEIMEKDAQDFLPIHHALRYGATPFLCDDEFPTNPLSSNPIYDWKSFIFRLLDESSEQCRVKSREGRLPLHYVLDHSASTNHSVSPLETTSGTNIVVQASRHAIIEKLIALCPESVDQKDPVTGLYPFMMASMDRGLSLNTVFCLLRRSPSRCLQVSRAQNH